MWEHGIVATSANLMVKVVIPMAWDTIIVAALALIGSLSGTYFANQKTTALMAYRIQELERKVEKHNNVVERLYKVEKDMATAFIRIDELKGEISK